MRSNGYLYRHLALTENSLSILSAIIKGSETGRQPSLRKLVLLTGVSLNAVRTHIVRLKRLGLIEESYCVRARATRAMCVFIPASVLLA